MKTTTTITERDIRHFFPILKLIRKQLKLNEIPFSSTGDALVVDVFSSRVLAMKLSQALPVPVKAGEVYGSALLHEIAHLLCRYYIQSIYPEAFKETAEAAARNLSPTDFATIITAYTDAFPPPEVFSETVSPEAWSKTPANTMLMLEELLLIRIANENPALSTLHPVFSDAALRAQYPVDKLIAISEKAFMLMPAVEVPGQKPMDLLSMLREPARRFPNSIKDQLAYILTAWKPLLGDILAKLLGVLDLIAEEEKPRFAGGPGPNQVLTFEGTEHEYEAFTSDSDWMPKVVMIAKSTLVWLYQLSKKYQRTITTLDAIPDEELEILARRGFNALWLIGLWGRSHASQRIKQL
ncbi:MAG TPA: alpha-amylase, partial [Spirochaetales bacterium]|nr:alpha-amylase [Spirochaetales bacterium]